MGEVGYFEQLLSKIEAAGYVGPDGNTLADAREWHELRQVVQRHPGWPGGTDPTMWDFIGTTSDKDAVPLDMGERRYMALGNPDAGETWETMESAPMDGREIEIKMPSGTVQRVVWSAVGIVRGWMTPGKELFIYWVHPTHWRPINAV